MSMLPIAVQSTSDNSDSPKIRFPEDRCLYKKVQTIVDYTFFAHCS
jgi:hypothetical protein